MKEVWNETMRYSIARPSIKCRCITTLGVLLALLVGWAAYGGAGANAAKPNLDWWSSPVDDVVDYFLEKSVLRFEETLPEFSARYPFPRNVIEAQHEAINSLRNGRRVLVDRESVGNITPEKAAAMRARLNSRSMEWADFRLNVEEAARRGLKTEEFLKGNTILARLRGAIPKPSGGGLKGSAIGLLLFGIPGFEDACTQGVNAVCGAGAFGVLGVRGAMSLCSEVSTRGCDAIANASGVDEDSPWRVGVPGLLTGLWNAYRDIENGNYQDVDRGGEDGAEGASGNVGDIGPGEPGEADISFGADDGTGSGDEEDGGNTANGTGSGPANGREPDEGASNESGGSSGSSDSSSGDSDQAEGPLYDFFCWLFGCDSDKKKANSSGSTRESDPPNPPEPPDDPCAGSDACARDRVDYQCPADVESCNLKHGISSGNELVDNMLASSPVQKGKAQSLDPCAKVNPDEGGLCAPPGSNPERETPAGRSPATGEGDRCGDPKAMPDPDQDNCGSNGGGIEYIGPSAQKPSNVDCDMEPDPEIGGCGQAKAAPERDPISPLVQ